MILNCQSGTRKTFFSFFYEPENLYQLAKQLELQSGVDIWEPSEKEASDVRRLMLTVAHRMVEFDEWMEEIVSGLL